MPYALQRPPAPARRDPAMTVMNGGMRNADFAGIARAALACAPDLLARWFPAGRLHGREFKIGNIRGDPGESLSINIDTGIWKDFARPDDRGSDLISVNAARLRVGQGEAAKGVANDIGLSMAGHGPASNRTNGANGHSPGQTNGHARKKPAELWEPQLPAPREPPEVPQIRHPAHGVASARWVYRDNGGNPLFTTVRFELPPAKDGTPRKEVLPYTYGCRVWTTKAGKRRDETGWHLKRPSQPVPLYGLDRLAAQPEAHVVVCEGERKADCVGTLFPGMVGVASQGGCGAANKADWSVLSGRHTTTWPDNDAAGRRYAADVAHLVTEAGAASAQIVAVPETWPDGWDLADEPPVGVTVEALRAMLAGALPLDTGPDVAPEDKQALNAEPDDEQATVLPDKQVREIERLSLLPELEYAAQRKPTAHRVGLGVGDLDRWVKAEKIRRSDAAAARDRAQSGPGPGEVRWPYGFTMRADGLYSDHGGDGVPVWLCGPLEVLGESRDAQGESWGLWLRWHDRDERVHTWSLPKRLLAVEPGKLEAELLSRGLNVSVPAPARTALRAALGGVRSASRVKLIARAGWHAPAGTEAAYVLPNGELVGSAGEHLVLDPQAENAAHAMTQAGTLEDWQRKIAALAVGNPIPAFMICMAFAGPLLDPLSEQSGGFHFFGRSKTGKTLALRMALSAMGQPQKGGLLRDWRSTAGGLEAAAEECSDGLLPLDEIHQADPREVVAGVYGLANESGKQRLRRDSMAQRRRTWRNVVISTGEIDVAAAVAKAGQTLPAGADVRLPSINVDDAMWPTLHGATSPNELMSRLQGSLSRYYGTAIRPFIARLAAERAKGGDDLERAAVGIRDKLVALLPLGADPQVHDVARRLALVALAGQTAIEWGILPWPKGEALRAAQEVMDRWLGRRGGGGSAEATHHVSLVRTFLFEHGASRFVALRWDGATRRWVETYPDRTVIQRAGWRREHGREETDAEAVDRMQEEADRAATYRHKHEATAVPPPEHVADEYLIHIDAWREMCAKAGTDPTETAKTLKRAGFLIPGDGKNLQKQVRAPGVGNARFYVVSPAIFGGWAGDQGGTS